MPNIHHRRRLVLDGTQMPAPVGDWSMARQVSTNGVLIDTSGNGHHGYYGGVKRALIGDTTYGDRGLLLSGLAGNNATVPDSAANRPTGDQWYFGDIRCADYSLSTGAPRVIQSRYAAAGNRSARFEINDVEGKLGLRWSADGTVSISVESTATLESVIANASRVQVLATLDVDNGAVGNDVKFWWRVPGGTWAQLGNTITTAGVTSVFAGTSAWECGTITVGAAAPMNGTIYAAKMGTGLVLDTGTTLSVDFSTQAQGTRSFTCTTGQSVTVNQSADTAAMPTRLWWTGTTYLWLPGSNDNCASVADFAGNRPTGDFWMYEDFAITDLTPSVESWLQARYTPTGDQRSEALTVLTTGALNLRWATLGTAVSVIQVNSTATLGSVGITDAQRVQVYATLDVDNGAVGNDVKFYWRVPGGSWAQLGATVTMAGVTSVHAGTAIWECGTSAVGGAGPWLGTVYGAKMGTGLVLDTGTTLSVDFTATASYNATHTTLTAVTGQAVTINVSATGLKSTVVNTNKCVGDGVDDYISVDDHARLDVDASGNLTLAAVARIKGTPAAEQVLIGKKSGVAAANAGYQMTLDTSRQLIARVTDGTDEAESTTAALVASGKTVCAMTLKRATNADTAYTNGLASAAADATAVGDLSNASEFRIFTGAAGTNFCAGELESVRLLNRPLTPGQILRLNSEL